jgi:ornithine carbamoyltransferase
MLLAPLAGMDFTMCCPEGYEPDGNIESGAKKSAASCGTAYALECDPVRAVADADVIYTDVWASMGQEDETEERSKVFSPYQVNADLMSHAKSDCLVSHCLPAHRGEEITSDVLDGSQSIALDEAENRLHVQKAVLYKLMSS